MSYANDDILIDISSSNTVREYERSLDSPVHNEAVNQHGPFRRDLDRVQMKTKNQNYMQCVAKLHMYIRTIKMLCILLQTQRTSV